MTHSGAVLPPSSTIKLVIRALAGQGQYGTVTELADEHGVSRQRVYRLKDQGYEALCSAFTDPPQGMSLLLTEADLKRSVVAMRVMAPVSIRDIEDLLPQLYGLHWSYGKIQGVLAEAEQRAAEWLAQVDLSAIDHVALDEMFSQGQPVLGGIDLDCGYLFALETAPCRKGAEWGQLLGTLRQDQKLHPEVVVKDAGSGLAQGVERAWPAAEQRDDLFHAVYEMGKVARSLEKRAYKTLGELDTLRDKRRRASGSKKRRSLGQRIRAAQEAVETAIDRYDRFETLRRQAADWLKLTERGCGRLRPADDVAAALKGIAGQMADIGGRRVCKVATYIDNRAEGLARYLSAMQRRLDAITDTVGGADVVAAVVRLWQARLEVEQGGPQWDRKARRQELDEATHGLVERCGADLRKIAGAMQAVLPIIEQRHRASSAIENLNSVLRPYLVVHKGLNQGFLDLFRFYWNTRRRRWGRHKGTSALQVLTGQQHADWLTLLGYPPAEASRDAA